MSKYLYDCVVLGGGAGGLVAAKFARGIGKKVAIIEKEKLGGECTWTGCVPSKTLLHTARVAHAARTAREVGFAQSVTLDPVNVFEHVRQVVQKVYSTHTPEKLAQENIEVIHGSPAFVDAHTISVDGRDITAGKIIIATGSSPALPPIDGLDTVPYRTNETLFELDRVPSRLGIIGGGPIGSEMATAFAYLGSSVTVFEMNQRILPREDEDLAFVLQEDLVRKGVVFITGAEVTVVRTERDKIAVTYQQNGEVKTYQCDELLVAVGRAPNLDGLNLDHVGIKTTKKGIVVDNYLRTTCSNVYACGDVVGPYQFSHVAEHQAMTAARNALLPFRKKMDYDDLVWVTFTDPEYASAGPTEEHARDKHGKIFVYTEPYSIDRAVTDNATTGRAKFICDARGQLISAHILGARAGELIHEVLLAKHARYPFTKLHYMMHAYPAYNDIIKRASRRAYIDKVQRNILVRAYTWLFGSQK